jgi:adenylate cyclase
LPWSNKSGEALAEKAASSLAPEKSPKSVEIPMNHRLEEAEPGVSREALSSLRLRIRAPLHQIISYCEIMTEDPAIEGHLSVLSSLAAMVDTCQAVLPLTYQSYFDHENLRGSVESWRGLLLEQSGRVLGLSQALQEQASAGQLSSLAGDIRKLSAAVRSFDDVLNGITAESLRKLTSPELVAKASNSNSPAGAPAKHNQPPAKLRSGLILVVDDNEGNRDVLSRRLLRDGCEVMLAESGRQALRMLRRFNFDLVLLDIMMPEMDGYEVLTALKEDSQLRRLPVIMITAVDEIESVVRCIELGADDYLLKPFNPTLLRARINALLERKQLLDQERERAQELERALADVETQRKKSEALLLNILPGTVAEELHAQGSVQPMYFEDVTIVFADFVGFTLSVEQLPAEELVALLHEYFTAFDNIVERYGLEKLKTIGDCYMFSGGLPERNPAHPVNALLAALEMVEVTRQRAVSGPVDWQLRIGVHTGPVVAGVVGIHKFAFDIWGDSVNLSSRMESSGAPGRVNMSFNTYSRVKDFFACEKRGRIKIKDGRELEMFFVNGIASGLLAGKSGPPQKAFEQRYRTYFRRPLPEFPCFLTEKAEN